MIYLIAGKLNLSVLSSEANWKLFSFHHKTLLMLTHTKQRRANILLL